MTLIFLFAHLICWTKSLWISISKKLRPISLLCFLCSLLPQVIYVLLRPLHFLSVFPLLFFFSFASICMQLKGCWLVTDFFFFVPHLIVIPNMNWCETIYNLHFNQCMLYASLQHIDMFNIAWYCNTLRQSYVTYGMAQYYLPKTWKIRRSATIWPRSFW